MRARPMTVVAGVRVSDLSESTAQLPIMSLSPKLARMSRFLIPAAVLFVAAGVLAVTVPSSWPLLLARVVLIALGIALLVGGLNDDTRRDLLDRMIHDAEQPRRTGRNS